MNIIAICGILTIFAFVIALIFLFVLIFTLRALHYFQQKVDPIQTFNPKTHKKTIYEIEQERQNQAWS